LISEGTKWTV